MIANFPECRTSKTKVITVIAIMIKIVSILKVNVIGLLIWNSKKKKGGGILYFVTLMYMHAYIHTDRYEIGFKIA